MAYFFVNVTAKCSIEEKTVVVVVGPKVLGLELICCMLQSCSHDGGRRGSKRELNYLIPSACRDPLW
jgi:hypothetical protein